MGVIDARRLPIRSLSEPSRRRVLATGLAGSLALAAQPVSAKAEGAGFEMEIKINPTHQVVTLINIFSVEPGGQDHQRRY